MKTNLRVLSCLILTLSLFFTCFPTSSQAVDYTFKLVASRTALEGDMEMLFPSLNPVMNSSIMGDNTMTVGFSGVYQSDDYKLASARALMGNDIFVRGLSGGLGFKAAVGTAEKSHVEDDIAALGFTGALSYDLSKEFGRDVPVTLLSGITLAPQPLCFSDTENFFEFLLECDWKVLEQAAVVASYRHLEVEFDNRHDWQKTDNTGYVGVKLFF